jgi:hypothetical protein
MSSYSNSQAPSVFSNWNSGFNLSWLNPQKDREKDRVREDIETNTISEQANEIVIAPNGKVIETPQEETQSAKAEEVGDLFKRKNGLFFEELAGTWLTYRHDWGEKKGQWILHLQWQEISPNSRIFVSIAEGSPTGEKIIGKARFSLHNVAPSDGSVSIWVDIQWDEPLRLYADYLVIA